MENKQIYLPVKAQQESIMGPVAGRELQEASCLLTSETGRDAPHTHVQHMPRIPALRELRHKEPHFKASNKVTPPNTHMRGCGSMAEC